MNDPRTAHIRLILMAFALALTLAACRDEGRSQLENELGERYGMVIVGASDSLANDLVVMFPSSPFADRTDAERRGTARKVADYVRDHYPGYKGIDKVTVAFLTPKETVAETLKHVGASYTFTRAQLGPPPPSQAP
jgi:hypothetical protein